MIVFYSAVIDSRYNGPVCAVSMLYERKGGLPSAVADSRYRKSHFVKFL
jgi:hypothetical protein